MNPSWLIYPIIASFLWASVNHLDKYLLDKYCKNREIGGLIIFSSLIGIPVAFVIYLFDPTVINIDLSSSIIITLAGCLYILGIIPYLYALDIDEPSVVAPQALMLTIFTGILGYTFLNETINFYQFLGITIILLGALTLSLDFIGMPSIKIKFNVFFLMLISSFLNGSHTFLFKYFAIDMSFWKTVFWLHIGFIVISIIFIVFIRNYRKEFLVLVKSNPVRIISINLIGEIVTILGNISAYYGTLFAPLAIAEGITEGIQPIFVVFISILITLFFPQVTKETINLKKLLHKLISILVMLYGMYLVIS